MKDLKKTQEVVLESAKSVEMMSKYVLDTEKAIEQRMEMAEKEEDFITKSAFRKQANDGLVSMHKAANRMSNAALEFASKMEGFTEVINNNGDFNSDFAVYTATLSASVADSIIEVYESIRTASQRVSRMPTPMPFTKE